tara:strand:+ start:687 stop:2018 length:1332 start_codon:yes stop_codon:yes gene_type:complete
MSKPQESQTLPTREILIVDDDPGQRSLLTTFLDTQGLTPVTVASGEDALAELGLHRYKMMISDVRMPGMSGLETLRKARQIQPDLPVLLVTAYADVKDAVGAMRDGAVNYLEKPIDLDELLESVSQIVSRSPSSVSSPSELPPSLTARHDITRQLYRDALLVAGSESPILITGEGGCGKTTLAELIHRRSARTDHPLQCLNCATMPAQQIGPRLFGSPNIEGLIKRATSTTLLIEEIGELPAASQTKLLEALGPDRPSPEPGGDRSHRPRLIVTSTADLLERVEGGAFRDDLFFRLNVIEFTIPPLRERPEDILPLATLFIKEYTHGHARFAATVTPCLEHYAWPGNVRELRNAMERAALMAHGGIILPKHLPGTIQKVADPEVGGEATQRQKMADVERETILQTLRENRNNRSVTARVLGISRRALTYKLQRYRTEGYLSED